MKIKSYKDLNIWKRSIRLVEEIYKITKNFPKEEIYGLTSQLRRSAVSIPSNTAEGFTRFHNKEYRQFLYISLGSCAELTTQVIISSHLFRETFTQHFRIILYKRAIFNSQPKTR
jgi:four helix bundle protein